MISDQLSLYSEEISYEEVGSDNSYSLDDQLTVRTCTQCCTVEQGELVIAKQHNWSLSSHSDHTIVCKYCREEVKKCYYDDHLVRCSECLMDCRFNCGNCSISCKKVKQHYRGCEAAIEYVSEEETQHIGYNFTVNCTAVEASD